MCAGAPYGVALPRLLEPGQVQVRHGEAGEPGLGLRPAAGRALVADLAAGAGRRPRERRDRRRVVVRLDLHQHVHVVLAAGVAARAVGRLGQPAHPPAADHHRGVVLVGDDRALAGDLLGVADHPEQRARLHLAVDDEVGVEDLVPAVLGVGLREHHQLDVGRVAPQPGERLDQVVDLVVGQGQAVGRVGLLDRPRARGRARRRAPSARPRARRTAPRRRPGSAARPRSSGRGAGRRPPPTPPR